MILFIQVAWPLNKNEMKKNNTRESYIKKYGMYVHRIQGKKAI